MYGLFNQASISVATEEAVGDLITYLDKDGDRQLGLIELEKSLRYLKRGVPFSLYNIHANRKGETSVCVMLTSLY